MVKTLPVPIFKAIRDIGKIRAEGRVPLCGRRISHAIRTLPIHRQGLFTDMERNAR